MDNQAIADLLIWGLFVAFAGIATHKIALASGAFWKKVGLYLGAGILLTALFGIPSRLLDK